MRYIIIIFILAFLLTGCQQAIDQQPIDKKVYPSESNLSEVKELTLSLFETDTSSIYSEELSQPRGFLAKPTQNGTYPAIIVIHEWWGLNNNIKQMAKILATKGYTVFAVDLYGEVATTPDKARNLSSNVRSNPQPAIDQMKTTVKYLREQQKASKVASMGWCFGGQQSLLLSVNEPLDGTIIYYGNLIKNQTQLKTINWPVLGIFGANDTSIPAQSVIEFNQTLLELGIKRDIYLYPGVGHAFANPSGANYAPNETMDAWNKTVMFLESVLK